MKMVNQQFIQVFMFLICSLFTSYAGAATFNLSFFDNANNVVGNGRFSFDSGRKFCVEINPIGDCNDPRSFDPTLMESGNVRIFKNPLTDFKVNLLGQSWRLEGSKWWAASGQAPGSSGQSRSGPVISNGWFFGDPFFGTRAFTMSMAVANGTFGSGVWLQTGQSPVVQGSGIWTAAVVPAPIPGAVWLLVSGLGALGLFRGAKKVREFNT